MSVLNLQCREDRLSQCQVLLGCIVHGQYNFIRTISACNYYLSLNHVHNQWGVVRDNSHSSYQTKCVHVYRSWPGLGLLPPLLLLLLTTVSQFQLSPVQSGNFSQNHSSHKCQDTLITRVQVSSTRGHTFHPDSEIGQSTFLQTRRTLVGGLGLVRCVGTKNFAKAWRTLQPYVETHFLESF